MKLSAKKISIKKRSAVKNQLLLLSVSLLVIVLLFSVGFLLAKTANNLSALDFLPEKNNLFLVLWRVFFYSVIIVLLTPDCLKWTLFYKNLNALNKSVLLKCRYIALISIGVYECIIVQNVLSHFIYWIISDVS